MERANLENLFEKVETIARGPHADLLEKIIDLLYEREMEEPEYFSPEDLAAIEEGKAQIARGETVSWEDLKRSWACELSGRVFPPGRERPEALRSGSPGAAQDSG